MHQVSDVILKNIFTKLLAPSLHQAGINLHQEIYSTVTCNAFGHIVRDCIPNIYDDDFCVKGQDF